MLLCLWKQLVLVWLPFALVLLLLRNKIQTDTVLYGSELLSMQGPASVERYLNIYSLNRLFIK